MAIILGYEPRRAIRALLAQRLFGAKGIDPTSGRSSPRVATPRLDWVDEPGQLIPAYARRPADVVLIGTDSANTVGVGMTRQLLTAYPTAVVIVLGDAKERHAQQAALALGAHGFLRLGDLCAPNPARAQAILDTAIPTATDPSAPVGGSTHHTPIQATADASSMGSAHPTRPIAEVGPVKELTKREHQILVGMSRGFNNQTIGQELFLSEDTVKTHARRLYRKLHVNDRAAAVAAGFRHNILY